MTDNAHSDDLRAEIVQASRLLFTAGVMPHSGHGNLSARVDENRFLLTSTGWSGIFVQSSSPQSP